MAAGGGVQTGIGRAAPSGRWASGRRPVSLRGPWNARAFGRRASCPPTRPLPIRTPPPASVSDRSGARVAGPHTERDPSLGQMLQRR